MTIGDPNAFPQLFCNYESSPVDSRDEGNRILLTQEAGEFLSTILEQLADFPSPQRGALLLSGDSGVDNLHFLHHLETLLGDPEHPSWPPLLQYLNLGDEIRPRIPLRTLFVALPSDPSEDLAVFLIDHFQQNLFEDFPLSPAVEGSAEEISALMQQIASRMVERSLAIIVLQNISERIEQSSDEKKINDELQLYRALSEVFSQNGVLPIFIAQRRHFDAHEKVIAPLTGEKTLNPGFCWIEATNASSFALPLSVPMHEEQFQEQLQLQIYEWIRTQIPSWKPEIGPRYLRNSQALPASIPEDEKAPKGLVYFKSVFDPYWMDEDLARLQGSVYAWVLMILNPCEHYYEFEGRLKEIGFRLPILLMWRPAMPSKAELEKLRGLVLQASASAVEEEPAAHEATQKVHGMLEELYIRRGLIIGSSGQQAICNSVKGRSIVQYLAACLRRLPLQKSGAIIQDSTPRVKAAQDRRAMRWAALLTGDMELEAGSYAQAEEELIEWWAKSVGGLSEKLPDFPEVFHTTRFWNELKYIEGPLTALRSVFQGLRSGNFSVPEAIDRAGLNFAWDEDRLLKWKQRLESLEEFILWLSAFMHAREYLCAAFPLGCENPDQLRESLLRSVEEPSRFLNAEARSEFEKRFLEFKKSYRNIYCRLHDDALSTMRALQKNEKKIDPVLLRNLDLLSGLQYTDKSYLNRVKLMAKWMQHNQCCLPLRQILEHYPRCYCNFNPCTNQNPAGSYILINSIISEGTEYFRSVLRRCGYLIMAELKTQHLDDGTLQQITTTLSDEPMVPLKPACIHTLNGIIAKHPSRFLAEFRKAKRSGGRIH